MGRWGDSMQMKQLEYVLEIAECKSITKAAQNLFISQQALSEALKLLEQELDFQIFERSYKGVAPTERGELFLQDLRYIMPIVHGWDQLADSWQQNKTVNILVQYILSDLLIDQSFIACTDKVKNIEIQWDTLSTTNIISQLEKEKDKIAIVALDVQAPMFQRLQKVSAEQNYMLEQLLTCPMIVLLRSNEDTSQTYHIDVENLAEKQLVCNQVVARIEAMKSIASYTNKKLYTLPQSVNVIDFMAQNEKTFVYLPELIAQKNQHVRSGELVMHVLRERQSLVTFCLIYNAKISVEEKELIKEMKKYFSE